MRVEKKFWLWVTLFSAFASMIWYSIFGITPNGIIGKFVFASNVCLLIWSAYKLGQYEEREIKTWILGR